MANRRSAMRGGITAALRDEARRKGVDPADLFSPRFLRDMTLRQNAMRGTSHEQIVLLGIIRAFGLTDLSRQVSFDTPMGRRFYDVYHPEGKVAFEVKAGRCSLRRFVRRQIEKDRYLTTRQTDVDGVIWCLFDGGSRTLLNALTRAELQVIDMSQSEPKP